MTARGSTLTRGSGGHALAAQWAVSFAAPSTGSDSWPSSFGETSRQSQHANAAAAGRARPLIQINEQTKWNDGDARFSGF
jgi:hypothetical protein